MYQAILRNRNISLEAKSIYSYLAGMAGVGGTCYPSVETMLYDLNIGRNRLSKYMNELVACGVVEKVREKNGNLYGRNVYKITNEAEVAKDLKRIYRAIENRAIEDEMIEIRAIENRTTNNNNINNNSTNNNNINNSITCPEPDKPAPDPSGILLPLNDNTYYDVPKESISKWREAYPAVDVEQQLKKMIAWLDANPKRRKTRRGINAFIVTWLSREQDKGGIYRNGGSRQQETAPVNNDLPPEYQEMYAKYLGKKPPDPDAPFQ